MPFWVRNLAGLWVVQFFTVAGFSSLMPFLPIYVRELGIESVADNGIWSGILFSAVFITTAAMSPVWGTLADRHGRKPMLLRALVAMAVCVALMGRAGDVWQLLILRLVQGVLGGSVPMANALMATSAPRERLGFAMGTLQTAMASGSIIGPLLGGSLADHFGIRTVFLLTAGLLIVAAVTAQVLVKENFAPEPRRPGEGFFDSVRETFGYGQLRVIFFLLFVAQFSAMIIEPIVTLYISTLQSSFSLGLATEAGLIFAAAGFTGLVAAPLWGRLGDRTGRYKVIVTLAVFGAALAYFPQGVVGDTQQLLALRSVLGIFNAATGPAVFALVACIVPSNRQGGAFGLTSTPIMLGNLAGPVAGGLLQAALGIRSVFFITGAMLLVVAFAAGLLVKDPVAVRARSAEIPSAG